MHCIGSAYVNNQLCRTAASAKQPEQALDSVLVCTELYYRLALLCRCSKANVHSTYTQ
jgi:hypothetical protein